MEDSSPTDPSSRNPHPSTSLFNLHGIINLDQLSLLFSQLIEQIDSQNQKISSLETKLAQCVKISDFFNELQRIDQSMKQLQTTAQRLDQQSSSMIQLPDGSLKKHTAGEVAQSNFYQIQIIQKKLKNYLLFEDYEIHRTQLTTFEKNIEHHYKEIKQLFQLVTLLQNQTMEHHMTLSQQETILQNKLDKSDLLQLQTMMNLILTYEEFKKDAERQLKELIEYVPQSKQQIEVLEVNCHQHEEKINEIERQLSVKYATRRDIHVLAKELKLHSEELETKAPLTDTESLSDSFSTLTEAVRETQIFVNTLSQDIYSIQSILPEKATIHQVNACLLIEEFEKYQSEMNYLLSNKASTMITDTIDGKLTIVEETLREERVKVDIAIKFVEWFTNRGKLYEHNIKIIDKHLKDLVSDSKIPRVHTVYLPGNQLRFDPIDPMHDNKTDEDEFDMRNIEDLNF